MNLVLCTPQLVVYDDVLPPEEHKAVWQLMQQEDYAPIPFGKGLYRFDDGQAQRSKSSYLWTCGAESLLPPCEKWVSRLDGSGKHYETATSRFVDIAANHREVVGTLNEDWIAIIQTPHIYLRGTGLSWHTDGTSYTGAFAYYAHPVWNCLWGGELLVADERTRLDRTRFDRKYLFDNEGESERLFDPGVGRFVLPKPNRLVLVASGNEHKMSKVHGAAGDHVRAVFAGFFLRPDAAARALTSSPD